MNVTLMEHRCADGVACAEVTSRLEAAQRARLEGVDNEAAIQRLLWWARQHADAHRHGQDMRCPPP